MSKVHRRGSPWFGPRLRSLRMARRMTQRALACASGVHVGTINGLENGRQRRLRWDTAMRLKDVLGMELLRQ